ncbi:MAG: hypothetical protein KGD58_17445 [Candidatus Lokiarchaeota archaeon]|nr:hypothetical protein [Candidatus Lokiarchaeota archaeon]
MKKSIYLIGALLLVAIIFSVSTNSVLASDEDDDDIDDEFEKLNIRDVEISFGENETEIESILRNGNQLDEIEVGVKYDEEGLEIEVSYESDYASESEFEIEFGVSFRKLIEYIDLDANNIFNPLIDNVIQEHELDSFQNVTYIEEQITAETSLHHLIVNSSDGIFILHVYFPEEFHILNNTLITPSKPKIDIEILNFNFSNSFSRLALDIRLESIVSYEEYETTEDEEKGYAFNEKAVSTINNDFTGIFSWNENATIDGMQSKVITSNLELDDNSSEDQRIYLNYDQGIHIYHDPKLGIEGILRSTILASFPWNFLFILLTITAISVSVAVPVYYYIHNHNQPTHQKKLSKPKTLEGKPATKSLPKLENIEVTALSESFYNIVNQFEWDTNEKEEFLKEMFSLTPEERDKVINEMIEKSKLTKK